MARIVLATIGSYGDLHPYLALGLGLQARGHRVTIATSGLYHDKLLAAGLDYAPLRPDISWEDKELVARLMHPKRGSEEVIRHWLMPRLRQTFEDLCAAVVGADLLVSADIVYAAPIVAAVTGVPWATSTVAPLSLFSAYDPPVFPVWQGLADLRVLGPRAMRPLMALARRLTEPWGAAARALRRELGLPPGPHPIMAAQHSPALDLALFSPVLGAPQPDWPPAVKQTGFLWYDRHEHDQGLAPELAAWLAAGPPPVCFTLGSAAVFAADDFYLEAAAAAQRAGLRAVLLVGLDPHPKLVDSVGADGFLASYAPFSELFPHCAAVVHQGGVGTTGQVLRAGRPALIVPRAHDQFDNGARVARLGAGRVLPRARFRAARVAAELRRLLDEPGYSVAAAEAGRRVAAEDGVGAAWAAVEGMLAG